MFSYCSLTIRQSWKWDSFNCIQPIYRGLTCTSFYLTQHCTCNVMLVLNIHNIMTYTEFVPGEYIYIFLKIH